MSPPSGAESELHAARRCRRPSMRGAVSAPTAAAAAGRNGIHMGSLLDKLGGGAFGVVRRAQHRRSGEVVAIKSPRHGGDELLREASLLAACGGDPAVVALRKVARGRRRGRGPNNNAGDGDVHLVMEFVGPKDLHDVLLDHRCRRQPFTEAEARRVMQQLLSGVERMHAHGVIHCDLKPGNVIVGDGGRLKICDFGLAMSVSVPAPADAELQGTPSYMAPELLLGGNDRVAVAVDMWSLGCVMAEVVAGKPLFFEENEFELAMAIIRFLGIPDDISGFPLKLKVAAPSKLRDVVPEERLSQAGFDVLRGLLEYSPSDRLTAAAALQMPWFATEIDDSPSSSSAVNCNLQNLSD